MKEDSFITKEKCSTSSEEEEDTLIEQTEETLNDEGNQEILEQERVQNEEENVSSEEGEVEEEEVEEEEVEEEEVEEGEVEEGDENEAVEGESSEEEEQPPFTPPKKQDAIEYFNNEDDTWISAVITSKIRGYKDWYNVRFTNRTMKNCSVLLSEESLWRFTDQRKNRYFRWKWGDLCQAMDEDD